MKMFALLLAAVALPVSAGAAPQRPAPVERPAPKAMQGMVSAADPRAAAAGVEILRAGGSATDAAIATMLALNVVEPQSAGIGGGAFFVLHDARTRRIATVDGREKAPDEADPRWFYDAAGQPMSKRVAVPGGRSVGVPGTLRAMAAAHRRGGKLPWAQLFQPAIRLARDGFAVSPRLANAIARFGDHIDGEGRALFFPGGTPRAAGSTFRNPEQAALFERLAQQGPDSFYVGPTAQRIVATVNGARRNPSKMTTGDLASYEAKERDPICGSYRLYRICGMGPPASGGLSVIAILKQLERFDLRRLGRNSPQAWHLIAESERLAYADRDMYIADPDYVRVPAKGLLDAKYLAARSALISPTRAMATVDAGTPPGAPPRVRAPVSEVPGTTSLSVIDGRGNVAQVTTTIEGSFGSGLATQGIALNNELTDFDIVPVKDGALVANRVEGGKRPRSSMSPTIVYDAQGKVRLALGAAGGSTIIAQIAKALIGVLDWDMSAQDAIGLGLVYAPGDTVNLEKGTPLEAMAPALRALGHTVEVTSLGLKANAIEVVGGQVRGGADPRSEGVAMAEDGSVAAITRNAGVRPAE